ncbi:hypothetical protein QMO56_23465 [Roseomonas sp. E05]|uniref:hypothetical protein n=1 Tax=Roseomonas sp. E05 TaxID=3046310 RepID=UPI0024BA9CC1|nr:hypothetical protein [Roseomonas sp. E05]MDJ0391074.1 hypothetical protein [Roseomonas sp. E05]
MAAQTPKQQPVLKLHPDSDIAAYQLMAFLAAPLDQRRQKEFLAVMAADLLETAPAYVARRLEQVAAVSLLHDDQQTLLGRYHRRVVGTLFLPAGGVSRLRDADSRQCWERELLRAQRGPAMAAGRLLLFIVQLALFHPTLTASTKRALAILEAWGRRTGPIPLQRDLPQVWSRCGGVAPVFGAVLLAQEYWASGGLRPEQAMAQSRLLRQLLPWMAWLRDFSLQHKARGASAPLLRREKAVELPAGITAQQPPLGPLPPDLLKAATAYKAPMYVE